MQGWDIKEAIVENFGGTNAETSHITLFVSFPSIEHIEQLPDSYEMYGYTLKLYHNKVVNPCTKCSSLHPGITIPNYQGDKC